MFSKTLLMFLFVNFVSDSYGQKAKKFFRKDYRYIEAVESFYKIHTIPRTWAEAKQVCALEAATFFYAENDNEAKAVLSFWNQTKPTIMWLWVGISDILVEGVFETVDDYIFSKDTGKCYKLHTTPLNWTESYAICQVEQSTLAMVSNRREADYLAKLAESTPKPRLKGKYHRGIYHLGFHNRLNEGWQTVKGTPMHVDADVWFDNYQPDGNDQEECGSMFYTGRLINTDCDTKSFFICEHQLDNINSPVSVSLTGSVLQPYVGGGIE